jgi:SAM-dependent methyltransferase
MGAKNAVSDISGRYQGDAGEQYHRKHAVPGQAHAWIARNRSAKFAPYVDPNDVVLEYGVGMGWNLDALVCKQRLGYDLSTFLEKPLAEKGIRFVADTHTMPDASVDTVICHHVLEHTPNPLTVLLEIGRLLGPSGKLLLVVPYERERRYRRFDENEKNHHLFAWNVQTLCNLVTAAGYRVNHAGIGRYGYDRFLSVWAARLGLSESGFNTLKTIVMSIMPLREVRIVASRIDASA